MMKRWTVLLLALMLLVPVGAWGEDGVKLAAPVDFAAQVEHLPGFSQEYDEWTLLAHETLALQQYMAQNGKNAPAFAGFYFSLSGNQDTGLVIPSVHVFYKGTPALGLASASFAVNGVRYDLVGKTETVHMGGTALEVMTVPLGREGMAFFRQVCSQQQITLQLTGSKTYHTVLQLTAEPKKTTDYITNACLKGASSLLKTLDGVFDMDAYQLWDLNAAYVGDTDDVIKTDLSWAVNAEPFAGSELGVLSVGDTGAAVALLQEQLTSRGFMVGPAGTQFNAALQSAVKMAQQYYGLPVTGFAERTLYECLLCDAPVKAEAAMEKAGAALANGDVCLTLQRFWLCNAVEAIHTESTLGSRSSNSADEVLLVLDGLVENAGLMAVKASEAFQARVDVNNVTYTGEVLFEKNGGTLLQDALDACTESRAVVVVRLPKMVAENAAAFTLTLNAGEEQLALELAK